MMLTVKVHQNRNGTIEHTSITVEDGGHTVVLIPHMGISIAELLKLGKMSGVVVQDTASLS